MLSEKLKDRFKVSNTAHDRILVAEACSLEAKLRAAEAAHRDAMGERDAYMKSYSEACETRNALQAEVARLREAMETDLIYVTSRMDEHPEGYEGACWCRSCCSYATDDGEGKP